MASKPVLAASAAFALALAAQAAEDGARLVDAALARALAANDARGATLLYAPDATLLPADAPALRGREEIGAYFAHMLARFSVEAFELEAGGYESQGTLSAGWGRFRAILAPRAGGEAVALEGRYSTVVKNLDGKLFFISHHLSLPAPPLPAAAPRPSAAPDPVPNLPAPYEAHPEPGMEAGPGGLE